MLTVTREFWLQTFVAFLRAHFEDAGLALPPFVRVSVGWPSTRSRTAPGRRNHEYVAGATLIAADGTPHIFISPLLTDVREVVATLVHELVHAVVGIRHGQAFRDGMNKVGLAGPATATHANPTLMRTLGVLIRMLPPYPHATLDVDIAKVRKPHVGYTTLLVANHVYHVLDGREAQCSYQVRATQRHLDLGLPLCPHGEPLMPAGESDAG
jgi:hypothetical protein